MLPIKSAETLCIFDDQSTMLQRNICGAALGKPKIILPRHGYLTNCLQKLQFYARLPNK